MDLHTRSRADTQVRTHETARHGGWERGRSERHAPVLSMAEVRRNPKRSTDRARGGGQRGPITNDVVGLIS